MTEILVTGAYGFVGTNISLHLAKIRGCSLIALDIFSRNNKDFIEGHTWNDLQNINRKKLNVIIHLAGLAHDTNNKKQAEEYFQINAGLTKTIYDFFLKSTAKTFIFFSTVKAATDFSETPLVEDLIPNPTSIYGKSKLLAENYILNNLPTDGRKVYILRPCMIHGPKPKGNLVSLYKYIKRGFPYPFGNLSNTRSYLSIVNLNFILEKLVESNDQSTVRSPQSTITPRPSTGIYHLADDQPLSTNRIIELIGESLGKKPRMINLPAWSMKSFAQLGTTFHLPVNNDAIKKLTGNFLVSNEKIKKALNVRNLPVSAEEGMRLTLRNIV